MEYKSSNKKMIFYIVILILGLILAFDNSDSAPENRLEGEQGEIIELKEGFKFIEARSTVTYQLIEDESITGITRMFGLRLKEEAILRLNQHLGEEYLEKKIPKGTTLTLFIQSRLK